MAMEIMNNYNNAYENTYAAQKQQATAKKKETSGAAATQKNSGTGINKTKNTAEYMKELEKLAPSVEFRTGNTYAADKTGKTLTINPKLLEDMQNDPEKEKEMKEMIKGVESMTKLMDGIYKASGWSVVYRHSYIDENGKYRAIAYVRNDFMYNMSDKLREERKKNSEKLIEKSKEKAAEKKKELQETLEKEKTETEEKKVGGEQEKSGIVIIKEDTPQEKAEKMLLEKIENLDNSSNGEIYFDNDDMQVIIDAVREDAQGKIDKVKDPVVAGNNFDMQI